MKGYRDTRLLEMLDYIDPKYIEKTKKYYKSIPARSAAGAKIDPKKQIKYIVALVASVLLLSAFIPAVTYIIQNHLNIGGIQETTGGDTTLTPDISSEEITSSPEPESTETEPETTDPLYDGTTAPPEIEYDGSRGLVYKLSDDGQSAWLFGMGTCTDTNIQVASVYDGLPVTGIGKEALAGYDRVRRITLPETLTEIGEGAFKNCTGLEGIVIPDAVSVIGAYAFENCASIRTLHLPAALEIIEEGILANCDSLSTVEVRNKIKRIVSGAFRGCTSLNELMYHGYKSQWAEVEVAADWHVGSAIRYVYCTDGTLAFAAAPEIDNENDGSRGLSYKINGGSATFTGIGSCTDNEIVIASSVKGVPVTAISASALKGHENLTSITIPDSVVNIGSSAFEGCTSLRRIEIGAGVSSIMSSAFQGCTSLEEIKVSPLNKNYSSAGNCLTSSSTKTLILAGKNAVIPADGSVETILAGAFSNAEWLTELVIPEGVKTVKTGAVVNCPKLEKLTLPSSVTGFEFGALTDCPALSAITVSDKNKTFSAKGNCLINTTLKRLVLGCSESVIPDDMGIVYIEESAFANAVSLQSIVIPEGITTINAHAFEGCASLKNISLPESLRTIADYAFFGCSALEAIEFPRSFRTIGNYAFSECTSLTSLDIGNYIEKVGEAAFKNCTGLKTLVIGRLSSWSNSDVYFGKSAFEDCRALETVDITATGYVSYNEAVFKNCTSLKSFKFMKTQSYVWKNMFYGCTSLEAVEFGTYLSEIRENAFYGCSSLNNISVGSKLTKIQTNAFANCLNLADFIYEGSMEEWYGITRDSTWHSGTKLTKVKCSDGSAIPSGVKIDHDGTVGTLYEIDEQTKTATLVGLGKWWASGGGTKIATTYKGYPVTKIADGIFKGNESFPKELLSGIKVIGKEAYAYNHRSEVDLTLPQGLEEIGDDAFRGCFSVKSLTYLGTIAEWNAIKKGENWHLGAAFSVVHCTDGDVELKTDAVLVDGTPGLAYKVFEDGTACLSGIGSCTETDIVIATTYKGYKVIGIGDYALREKTQIKSVVIPEGITYIDEFAFYGCSSLARVELPNSLKSIGAYAFAYCPALESIDLPEGLTSIIGDAFVRTSIKKLYIPKSVTDLQYIVCDSLETLEIHPDNPKYRSVGNCFIDKETKTLIRVFGQPTFPNDGSIEIIGEGAMWGRDDITELIFPEGVKHIYYSSVGRLKNLKKLHIPSTLVEIDYPIESSFGLTGLEVITVAAGNPIYYAKDNCLIKKDTGTLILVNKYGKMPTDGSIKIIGYGAFSGFSELKSIVIPEGVVSIGSSAFSSCTALESVSFPESIESIGSWAFYSCTSLKKVSLGDNVKSFGTEVFAGCTALEEITLPKQVEYWSFGIFSSCKSLRRIVVPYGVKDFDIRRCTSLIEVVLPETVTFASFDGCTSLRTVILPESMTSMYDMFNGCTALEEIVLPAGLSEIYSKAFYGCTSLKKVVIEGDVTEIGAEAFKNCSSLETVTLPASLTSIKTDAFRGCTALREIVFEGSREEWEKISKGANWDTETVLAIIRCSDGNITTDAQPEDYSDIEKLPEALKAVLLGKSTFRYADTDKDMLLDDIETYWESGKLADMEHVAYAVVDMDGDGALEVIVSSYCTKGVYESNSGDKIILREYNGKVYGYHFNGSILDGDHMEDIKTDGSFIWNNAYRCYSTISFSGSSYTITTHCKYRSFGADFEYLIGDTKVTREEFNEYAKRFAKDQVIWYDLDRYPLGSSEQN